MPQPRTIPLLPSADIDEIDGFFSVLGFRVTYRQQRPYACLALAGHGFDLQYYGLDGHTPESSHSSCLVIVDDTGPIWDLFAADLSRHYGRLPISGFPRITRPRARKNAEGRSGFSLIDPAGNWIRFFRGGEPESPNTEAITAEPSRLGGAFQNAVVLADSKGDVAQAAKILRGALKRATDDDPSLSEARDFLSELHERLRDSTS